MAYGQRLSIFLLVVLALGLAQFGCAMASARTLYVDNQNEDTRTGVPFHVSVENTGFVNGVCSTPILIPFVLYAHYQAPPYGVAFTVSDPENAYESIHVKEVTLHYGYEVTVPVEVRSGSSPFRNSDGKRTATVDVVEGLMKHAAVEVRVVAELIRKDGETVDFQAAGWLNTNTEEGVTDFITFVKSV